MNEIEMMRPTSLQLHPLIMSGMVLQREQPLQLAGWAVPGSDVQLRLEGPDEARQSASATADESGAWCIALEPLAAGGPYVLELLSGEERQRVEDILVGDVYLAGGQSNMQLAFGESARYREDRAAFDDPQLRFFQVELRDDIREPAWEWRPGRWAPLVSPAMDAFSAVACYAGRALRDADPTVPVGLIGCYMGATSATCWTSRASLDALPALRVYDEAFAARIEPYRDPEVYAAALRDYQEKAEARQHLVDAYRAEHPDADEVDIEEAVGPGFWPPPENATSFLRPAGLYETMLAPLAPLRIRAAIWYQGESDADPNHIHYRVLMEAMIGDWRRLFGPHGFYQVQLPSWFPDPQADDNQSWGRLREAQRQASLTIPEVGHVVALDQSQLRSLHPPAKHVIGARLARLIRARLFDDGAPDDAYVEAATSSLEGIRIALASQSPALCWTEVEGSGFMLGDAGGQWQPVPRDAVTLRDGAIEIAVPEGVEATHVAYGQSNAALATLVGCEGRGALEAFVLALD